MLSIMPYGKHIRVNQLGHRPSYKPASLNIVYGNLQLTELSSCIYTAVAKHKW